MSEKIEKKVLALMLLFFCASMSVMIIYDRQRPVVSETEQAVEGQAEKNNKAAEKARIPFVTGMENAAAVVMPVPAGIGRQDVTVENRYREHEIWIEIAGMDEAFLYENGIAGSLDGIEEYACEKTERGVLFYLTVDSVYECMVEESSGMLCFKLLEPSEVSGRILLIDAGHGGTDDGNVVSNMKEKDFVLTVAMDMQKKLREQGVLVYCTREQDADVTEEERLALIEETQADFCVSLHLAAKQEDVSLYGVSAYYNSTFFIEGFSGGDLAYTVGQALSAQRNVKGLGIFAGETEDALLRDAGIATALVELGYLTNEKELNKLKQAAYREELTDGLCEGILAAYAQKEELK